MVPSLASLLPYADVAAGARLLRRLPFFLRHPLSVDEARATLRLRLDRREADFLTIAKRAVYEHSGSPYRQLLKLAGCEFGDLERLVSTDGVEAALRTLYRHGVYLTVDEFKGRRPVVRGNTTIAVDPGRLRNPQSALHVLVRSSGSRGAGTPVVLDLAFLRDRAVDISLVLEAWGGARWLHGLWGVPGAAAMAQLLECCSCGAPPVRWFSQIEPAAPGLHPRYRWSGRVMRWGSLLAAVPLPPSEYVPLDGPLPVARWMAQVLRTGQAPILHTFPSSAVRLCQAALEAGIDLRGAHFTVVGEPLTEARLAAIRRTGADAIPRYAAIECGPIGLGCLLRDGPDDVHLLHDLCAVIQPGQDAKSCGLPGKALMISSLRSTAPFILLNVSMGDQAMVLQRQCGCPLERLGWTTHLHTIRSHEKLTCGGIPFLDTDVIRVLEEVLPARFGGAPTHYQLLEEEADDGRPRLRLLVHPAVGPLDINAVADVFLTSIGTGSGVERVTELVWRSSGILGVERRAPRTTASGKILHLHLERRPAVAPSSQSST